MTKTLTAIALATGLAAGIAAAPAGAQTSALGTMEVGLSMLELAVQRELGRIGIRDVDVTELSLNEISQLRLILSDTQMESDTIRDRVRTVLEGRSATIQ